MSLSASARSCAVAFCRSANRPPPLRNADICSWDSEYIRSRAEATLVSVSVVMDATLRGDAVRVRCPLGSVLDEDDVVRQRVARHPQRIAGEVGVGVADGQTAQNAHLLADAQVFANRLGVA